MCASYQTPSNLFVECMHCKTFNLISVISELHASSVHYTSARELNCIFLIPTSASLPEVQWLDSDTDQPPY